MQCITTYPQPSFASVIENINKELRQKGRLISTGDESGGPSANADDDQASWLDQCHTENRQLISEMRTQNFDVIRFATYRTACKLRFIQKITNLYLVDIWNMIEAFRQTGLSTLDNSAEVTVSALETLLTCMFCALNKRLPNSAQIDVNNSVQRLYSFIVCAYDVDGRGQLCVLSIKTALAILCSGKFVDKLKYLFSLVCDGSGLLMKNRFSSLLQDMLTLPVAVYEGPSFEFNNAALRSCFGDMHQISLNEFLDVLTSEPGPPCLLWMPILHRLASVENVYHSVAGEGCHRESFTGFRYKCQRCYNYNLCQDCFWRGRTSGNHQNDHDVKEYSYFKSSSKQLGEMMKKSMNCIPNKTSSLRLHRNTDDLVSDDCNVVTLSSPGDTTMCDKVGVSCHSPARRSTSLDRSATKPSVDNAHSMKMNSQNIHDDQDNQVNDDDEHRLIARYTARLAADANNALRSPVELAYVNNSNRIQRELIAQLEAKNRDIMHEIYRLRLEQENHSRVQAAALSQTSNLMASSGGGALAQSRNPVLMAELHGLRQRRDELEQRMGGLQASRKELMSQLESLMNLLQKSSCPGKSPIISPRCVPVQPAINAAISNRMQCDPLSGSSGNVLSAFRLPVVDNTDLNLQQQQQQQLSASVNSVCGMRNSLLVAADSVTDAMSSLVRELNSEVSSDEGETNNDQSFRKRALTDEFSPWTNKNSDSNRNDLRVSASDKQETNIVGNNGQQTVLAAQSSNASHDIDGNFVKIRNDSNNHGAQSQPPLHHQHHHHQYPSAAGEDDSCLETDQESSYIRTDEEEAGNTEWEDATRRWVNR